ncbi:MAG TPA: peptidyl-prolyl cis-trans isomerase [Phycisphaerae bacterium]|nr:peptidyl-prolyl cis-trans isomerase [Phycisphaerae bacterium]
MTQTPPKLQLPESRPRERSGLSGLVFVLLLVVLVVQILGLFISAGDSKPYPFIIKEPQLSVDQVREAAMELERKNVSGEAADLWNEYLGMARVDALEEGNIRYRIGKNRQNANEPEKAYAQFVMAEILLGDSNPELTDEIKRRRRECLRHMGQLADLAREISEQSRPPGDKTVEGDQVVAEIGDEKITVADFDRMLTEQIELAVKSRPGQTPAEEQINRERYHQQLADPDRRATSLGNLVITRVLAQEARKEHLHEAPEFRERLSAMADSVLAQTLLFEEVNQRATVTDDDVKRFYEAHKDRYTQPAASFIAHVQCADEASARDVIARVQSGASFEDIVKAESKDRSTRDKLGILADPVLASGDEVPLFGKNAKLHDAIRDAEAGSVLPDPYRSPMGWHAIKVMSHRVEQAQPLEDIFDQVKQDTKAARTQEVTHQYIQELENRYKVKLYPQALGATGDASPADANSSGMP